MKYKDLKKKLKGASKENYSLIYEYMDFLERTKGNNRSSKGILHYGANKKLIPLEKENSNVLDSKFLQLFNERSGTHNNPKTLKEPLKLDNDKWTLFVNSLDRFTDDFMSEGRENFSQANRELL